MSPEHFCYWLQGFIELQDADRRERKAGLTEEQRTVIRDHLDLVFKKVTPQRSSKGLINEEKLEGLLKKEVCDPFERPDVYCTPMPGKIC